MSVQPLSTGLFAVILLSSAALGLSACRTPEPESPPAVITQGTTPKAPELGRGASRVKAEGAYSMYVAPPVREVCSGSVPFFEFDSAATRETDQPTMSTLANCMRNGPLVGKSIILIGHTDPRGTAAYNDKLGLERAERVRDYLVAHGIEASRVKVESRGEDDSSPAAADWPKDRRVEIRLAE